MKLVRIMAAVALSLTLAACFYGPGAFTSTLDLRKDGSFAFAYKGEIVFLTPPDSSKELSGWTDDMASCDEGEAGYYKSRPCTPTEIAEKRKEWEKARLAQLEKNKKEAEQFGAMFGYTPGNDEANKKLAASMMRYEGWKSVTYKGNGVFDVDFQVSGTLDHDFVFPLMPQSNMVLPFVMIRRQSDGTARVSAPALVAGFSDMFSKGMAGMGGGAAGAGATASRAKGSFTITTGGEIRTNNTEEGPADAPNGRRLVWQIGPDSKNAPEALIRLK